ncbi:MAG: hypothetical protein ACKV22_15870 [Bryobacteraceae bacterium]
MATRYGWMADTDEQAFAALVELQRKMSPGQKLAAVLEMAAMAIRANEDQVRREFPKASEREVFLRAASIRLGAETVARVYGRAAGSA